MSDYASPAPPRSLGLAGKRLWRTVTGEWQLEAGAEELELLRHACDAQDQCNKAQKALDDAGSLTFIDRFGQPHERPEVRIIRQSRAAVAQLLKQISQSQIAIQRLELAAEKHSRVSAEKERAAELHKDRRGGGRRRHG